MLRTIRRALISVSDKTGLVELAKVLIGFGVEIISTGGTRQTLLQANIPAKEISEVTNFPEMLDGRVKTLHPIVYAGILARREVSEHMETLKEHQIETIDLIVCNLYPFERVFNKSGSTDEEIIENIDIGGPTMLRAAAKNFESVAVVASPDQYPDLIKELMDNQGSFSLATRRQLAKSVFERTARYDAAIASYFARGETLTEEWPPTFVPNFVKKTKLRYGENPHQRAAFYVEVPSGKDTVAGAEVLHGKELSYNNLLDLDSSLSLVREFSEPAAVVIKHNNPCGAAIGSTLAEAFRKAFDGDPLSAFGGILAFNRPVDLATANIIAEPNHFVECIIAPDFDSDAFDLLTTKRKWGENVRLLKTGPFTENTTSLDYRRVEGGILLQTRDRGADNQSDWKVVTKRQPTPEELETLWFTWRVCKHVKSNAIVLGKSGMIVGVGAGQMSRVDSVQISIRKAGDRVKGAVLASDAFFPFRDNVDAAASAGVTAIVQPGGSQKDKDSIAACDEHGLTMLFTGVRHFKH